MKKFVVFAVTLLLAISHGLSAGTGQPIQRQKTDVVFIGYKATVKVNADPAEVEKYALDIKNMSIKISGHTMEILRTSPMQKLGDLADFREYIYRMLFPGTFVFVYYKPGEEVWYLSKLEADNISLLRLEADPIPGGTKVTIKYELQQSKNWKYQLARMVNVQNVMAKLIDHEIVKLQAHFDPSLNQQELLGKGRIGEFYNAFYMGEQFIVKIDAPRAKVYDYLTSPQSWKSWKDRFGYDFGQCLSDGNPGQCPVSVNILGQDVKADSFSGTFKPGSYSSAYWVAKPAVAGIGASLKPQLGGTKLSVQYMISAPYEMGTQQSDLMLIILQIPQAIEDFLVNAKKDIETGK